jgi:hypothetical protein
MLPANEKKENLSNENSKKNLNYAKVIVKFNQSIIKAKENQYKTAFSENVLKGNFEFIHFLIRKSAQ